MKNHAHYQHHLNSPAWRRIRKKRLIADHHQCRHCGSKRHLEVHHHTYQRLGRERLGDLLTLCHFCHKALHQTQKHHRHASHSNTPRKIGYL